MARNLPGPGRAPAKPRRPARPETPVRNGLLLLLLLAALVFLIGVMPKERARISAVGPNGEPGGQYTVPEDIPLVFSEVMAANQSAVPDEACAFPDWVELENTSDAPLNVGGLGLSDRKDRVLFVFPAMEVPPGGFIVVFCDGMESAEGPSPHARFKISSAGETLFLFDRGNQVIDTLEVPKLSPNVSYARMSGGFVATEQYTPGFANTQPGRNEMLSQTTNIARGLVVNEVLASSLNGLRDEDDEAQDWIELHNRGTQPIDLSSFCLSDDPENPLKWRFASGVTIGPGAYMVVFASGKNRPGGDGLSPHTGFGLAAERETVILSDIYGQRIDSVIFDNLGRDVSYGRTPGNPSIFREFRNPTPGKSNDNSADE